MPRKKTPQPKKRSRAKPVSLYGIPFEEAEGLLKVKPPEKKKRKQKNGRR